MLTYAIEATLYGHIISRLIWIIILLTHALEVIYKEHSPADKSTNGSQNVSNCLTPYDDMGGKKHLCDRPSIDFLQRAATLIGETVGPMKSERKDFEIVHPWKPFWFPILLQVR